VKTILIASKIGDVHTRSAMLGLRHLGHNVVRWFGGDFPIYDTMTTDVANNSDLSVKLSLVDGDLVESPDTVWFRRCKLPSLQDEHLSITLDKDDRKYAEREIVAAYRGCWHLLSMGSFWVNSISSAEKSRHKMLQLIIAKQVGFKIPKTRISNSAEDIRTFLKEESSSGYIYKPFYSAYWELNDGGFARLPTTNIRLDHLPRDKVLQLTPGIFQERIEKKYEIRATFMGQSYIAVKINSQGNVDAETDWRVANIKDLGIERVDLPNAIYQSCLKLMEKYGLVFGCFDFIVSSDDEYVFLEINEAGQFLWIESALKDIPLLDMMCQFLISGSHDFKYQERSQLISHEDIVKSKEFCILQEEEETQHIKAASILSDIL
jgi:glutathione synthase/RimK-type ligase-like ATP-grasp enzyme